MSAEGNPVHKVIDKPLSRVDEMLLRYVDDRLDPEDRAHAENLLAENPETAQRIAEWKAHDAAIHKHFDAIAHTAMPQHLLRTVQRAARRSPLRYAAAIAWLVVGGLVGWAGHAEFAQQPAPELASLPHIAAIAHVTYEPEKRHAVEVAASEEAHLVMWLSKKLGRPLKVPELNSMGYALVGGRLLPSESGPVAQFMFQNDGGKRLTLYLRTQSGDVGETSFQFAQEGKVGTFYWLDDSIGYAISGEVERNDLLALARETYRQCSQ